MKIEVSNYMALDLAEGCAKRILAAVVSMRLRLTGMPAASYHAENLSEIRALLRSIQDEPGCFGARANFVRLVGIYFRSFRKKEGVEVRWQDHLKKVRAAHPELITPQAAEKLAIAA